MIQQRNNKKRIQIVFTKEWIRLLDQLKEETGASSRAEVVRDAIALLDLVTAYTKKGYNITAIKEEASGNHEVRKETHIEIPKGRFPLSLSSTIASN